MPYIKITYRPVTEHVWVKVDTDDVALDSEGLDDLFDVVNSDQTVEAEYGEPVDELPEGVTRDWDLTQ